jgi:hypothetical protein
MEAQCIDAAHHLSPSVCQGLPLVLRQALSYQTYALSKERGRPHDDLAPARGCDLRPTNKRLASCRHCGFNVGLPSNWEADDRAHWVRWIPTRFMIGPGLPIAADQVRCNS